MQKPHLIGILNITPDSFSDGGQFDSTNKALAQARQLFADGAAIVDVGAESTRPGAQAVDPAEERGRLEAFFQQIINDQLSITSLSNIENSKLRIENFSLDTRNPATAEKFLQLGGTIINDVSGFQHSEMRALAAQYDARCIVNHFPGKTIDEVHEQEISSINKVQDELLARAQQLTEQGIEREKIILDPGIGFGKTEALNWELLKFATRVPNYPVLIGHSKKRFLGEDRFKRGANVAAAKTAQAAGAQYLRVHNPAWY